MTRRLLKYSNCLSLGWEITQLESGFGTRNIYIQTLIHVRKYIHTYIFKSWVALSNSLYRSQPQLSSSLKWSKNRLLLVCNLYIHMYLHTYEHTYIHEYMYKMCRNMCMYSVNHLSQHSKVNSSVE